MWTMTVGVGVVNKWMWPSYSHEAVRRRLGTYLRVLLRRRKTVTVYPGPVPNNIGQERYS